jgi:hypothetical protein
VFRTNDEFLEFITGTLSKIPGITRTSSSAVLRLIKRSMSFALPRALARKDRAETRARTRSRIGRKNPEVSNP